MDRFQNFPSSTEDQPFFWIVIKSCKNSILPTGFPIIVDELTRIVCEPALLFLYDEYVKAKSSNVVVNTVIAYAEDLKEWFRYCEEFQFAWTSASETDFTLFGSAMRATYSPQTGKEYATETINRRRSTVLLFYKWARERNSYHDELHADALLHPELDFETVSERLRVPLPPNAEEVEEAAVMQRPQARAILTALGPLPSERTYEKQQERLKWLSKDKSDVEIFSIKSSRDRLAGTIALEVGLRISEIKNLKCRQFSIFSAEPSNTEPCKIRITGKGNHSRTVYFPGWLVREIYHYINEERCEIIASGLHHKHTDALLINPPDAGRWAGISVSVRTLQRKFSEACVRSGQTKIEERRAFDTGGNATVSDVVVPLFVFHDFRHTYAVWTYYSRKETDSEPWLFIQARLGHKHLSTTLKYYLKVASDFEASVSDMHMQNTKPNETTV